jgi:hypothetical protein
MRPKTQLAGVMSMKNLSEIFPTLAGNRSLDLARLKNEKN